MSTPTNRGYCTWEESFGSDDAEFHDENDIAVGLVRKVGGSWQAFYRGSCIAFRPTAQLAMKAVTETHKECA